MNFSNATMFTWLTMLLRAIVVIILTPIIIDKYSLNEDISLWIVCLTIYNLILLFDAGFCPTFSRYYAYCKNEEYSDFTKGDLLLCQNKVYRVIITVSFFITLIVLYIYKTPIDIYMIIFVLSILCNLFYCKYIAALEGSGFISISRMITFIQVVGQIILLLTGLFFNCNQNYLIILYYSPIIISLFIFKSYSTRYVKNSNSNSNSNSNIIIRQSIKSAISLFTTIGTIQIVTIYYSSYYESNANDILYSLMLVRQLANFSQVPFYIRLPYMTSLFSHGDVITLKREAIKRVLLSLSLLLLSGVFIIYSQKFFYNIIKFPIENEEMWILLVISFMVERLFAMYQHYMAIFNVIVWHVTGIVFSIIVFLMLYIADKFEILEYGVPLSISVASLICLFYAYCFFSKYIDEKDS